MLDRLSGYTAGLQIPDFGDIVSDSDERVAVIGTYCQHGHGYHSCGKWKWYAGREAPQSEGSIQGNEKDSFQVCRDAELGIDITLYYLPKPRRVVTAAS